MLQFSRQVPANSRRNNTLLRYVRIRVLSGEPV